MEHAQGKAGGAVGLWLNKRSILRFEIPIAHELTAQPAGWRLDVSEPGKVVFFFDRDRVPIDLEPGDYVLASGDDVYVALQRRRDDRDDGRKDEKSRDQDSGRPAERAAGGGDDHGPERPASGGEV